MDDWNSNPEGGLSWRLYLVLGFFAIVALVIAVAYAVAHFAPSP